MRHRSALLSPTPPPQPILTCWSRSQVFFALRSEYFKALLADHFCEAEQSSDGIPRIHIRGVHPQVFAAIVHYVYTNQVITEVGRSRPRHRRQQRLSSPVVKRAFV